MEFLKKDEIGKKNDPSNGPMNGKREIETKEEVHQKA